MRSYLTLPLLIASSWLSFDLRRSHLLPAQRLRWVHQYHMGVCQPLPTQFTLHHPKVISETLKDYVDFSVRMFLMPLMTLYIITVRRPDLKNIQMFLQEAGGMSNISLTICYLYMIACFPKTDRVTFSIWARALGYTASILSVGKLLHQSWQLYCLGDKRKIVRCPGGLWADDSVWMTTSRMEMTK